MNEAPLLALVRLKEVDRIMETVLLFIFHIGANANGGGAAKGRYAVKILLQWIAIKGVV